MAIPDLSLKILFIKCLTQQTKALIMVITLSIDHLHSYALLQRIGLTLPKSCLLKIQSNGFKTCFIRIKTQYNVKNIKFYCNTKVKTTALHNLFVYDFLDLVVVLIILAKQEKRCMKRQLNMFGLLIIVLVTTISATA